MKEKAMSKRAPLSRRVAVKKALGPGMHAGVVELESEGSYRVALVAGGHVRAHVEKGLSVRFVGTCMKTGQRVLLMDTPRGPEILGALHAPRELPGGEEESVELKGKIIRLRATDEVQIQVGKSTLRLDKTGAARLEGRKLVLDIASLIRMLSARVELP
jgi:hypothetical protein